MPRYMSLNMSLCMCSKSFELNEILWPDFRLCVLLSLVMPRTLFRPWIRVRGVTGNLTKRALKSQTIQAIF